MLPPHTSEKLQPDQIADIDNKMNRQIPIAIMSLVGWQMLLQTSRMVNGKRWVMEVSWDNMPVQRGECRQWKNGQEIEENTNLL